MIEKYKEVIGFEFNRSSDNSTHIIEKVIEDRKGIYFYSSRKIPDSARPLYSVFGLDYMERYTNMMDYIRMKKINKI